MSASVSTGRGSLPVPPGPASIAEATMQPKLCPMRWKRVSTAAPCSALSRSCAPASPTTRARSFIFQNESWRSGDSSPPKLKPLKLIASSSRPR